MGLLRGKGGPPVEAEENLDLKEGDHSEILHCKSGPLFGVKEGVNRTEEKDSEMLQKKSGYPRKTEGSLNPREGEDSEIISAMKKQLDGSQKGMRRKTRTSIMILAHLINAMITYLVEVAGLRQNQSVL